MYHVLPHFDVQKFLIGRDELTLTEAIDAARASIKKLLRNKWNH